MSFPIVKFLFRYPLLSNAHTLLVSAPLACGLFFGSVTAADDLGDADLLGMPPSRLYSFDEIGYVSPGAHLSTDSLGALVAVQDGGLAVFDGRNWNNRLAKGEVDNVVAQIESAPDGRMYYGTAGDWGYITHRPNGLYQKNSLRPQDTPEWLRRAKFDHILFVGQQVVFWGDQGLVVYDQEVERRVFVEVVGATTVFALNERIFVSSFLGGIRELNSAFELEAVVGCEETVVVKVTGWDSERVIAFTEDQRLVHFDGATVEPCQAAIGDFLAKGVTAMHQLADRKVSIAIIGVGLFVLNEQYGIDLEMTDSSYWNIEDLECNEPGVLWVSSEAGIIKLLYDPLVTAFDYRVGLRIKWPDVIKHNGSHLVLSEGKIYKREKKAVGKVNAFVPLDASIPGGAWMAASTAHGILVANGGGLYHYSDDGAVSPVIENLSVTDVIYTDGETQTCLVIGQDWITAVRWDGTRWAEFTERVPGLGTPMVSLATSPNSVWTELGIDAVGHISLIDDKIVAVLHSDFEWDLKVWLNVGSINGTTVIVHGPDSYLFYDEKKRTFVEAPELRALLNSLPSLPLRPLSDDDGNIWVPYADGVYLVVKEGDGYRIDVDSLSLVRSYAPRVKIIDGNDVWFCGARTLMRVEKDKLDLQYRKPQPILARVVDSRRNIALYDALESGDEGSLLSIPYNSNSLNFQFLPGTYSLMKTPTYQYKLGGYSGEWSVPVSDSTISLTSLKEGDYKMEIRLVEGGAVVGEASEFSFSIAPPIYRTWYAYVTCAILIVASMYGVLWYFGGRDRRQTAYLGQLVGERTRELDKLNEDLQISVRKATEAEKAKSQFLANMSHEIRTPMNGVMGMCTLLQDTPLTPNQADYVGTIRASGETLLAVINDILDFSKIEAGKLVLEEIEFCLEELVENVLDLLAPGAHEKGIELVWRLEGEVAKRRKADPTRISQILVNLIGNAIKFTSEGEVLLRIWEEPTDRSQLRIAIEDTGIGIHPDKLSNLFRPFTQADESTSRKFGGSGLGLSISRMLVERMGGEIWAESEQGHGSAFHFSVSAPSLHENPVATSSHWRLRDKRVVIVDDSQSNLDVLKNWVTDWGLQPTCFSDPAKALAYFRSGASVDLLLVDYMMPTVDGLQLVEATRKESLRSAVPVVMMAGLKSAHVRAGAERLGIQDVLGKPVRRRQLYDRVLQALGGETTAASAVVHNRVEGLARSDRSLRILLAEDNPVNQKVAKLLLKRMGFQVDLAGNGIEAVESACRQTYDVVLMDVQMPEMDGLEATRLIRSRGLSQERLPIYALTAGVTASEIQSCLDVGMDGLLRKPINVAELNGVLQGVLDRTANSPR